MIGRTAESVAISGEVERMAMFALTQPNVIKLKAMRNIRGLARALKHRGDSGVRVDAAEALGELRNRLAVPPLVGALRDENRLVRKSAAEALGKIGDSSALEPLLEALNDEDCFVQAKAAAALGKMGDRRAINPLLCFIHDVEHEYVRETARAAVNAIKMQLTFV